MALPGGSIGTIFVEIDLDADRYLKSQQQLYKDATQTTLNIEANFKKLGIHSSAEMDLMRAKITNAYDMIAHSSKATANDIMRAEEAKNARLKELAEQQYGHQTSLLEKLKAHWIEAGAVIYTAMKFGQMVKGWAELAIAQDKCDRTLKAAMITNNRYSEAFYQSTLRHAEALQRLTGEDDAVIESAQRLLMVFDAVSNDLMPRATKAVMNMSIAIGPEGGGLRGSTLALGKAMEGSIEGLKKYGVVIDENVYKLRGAEGVLAAVEAKVNGHVEAVGQGSGQWKLLGSAIGEAKEKIGNFFNVVAEKSGLLDTLTQAVDKLNDILRKFNKLEYENLFDVIGFDKEVFNAIKYIQEQQVLAETILKQPTLAETILEKTKALTEITPKLHELTEAEKKVANALEEINNIIAKGTLTPYQFEVYGLDKKFQGLASTLGWTKDMLKAYSLELDEIKRKHPILFPQQPTGIMAFTGSEAWENLTLGGGLPAISARGQAAAQWEIDTAQIEREAEALAKRDIAAWDKVQAKIKEAQEEIQRQWDKTAKSIGSSFTDTLVDTIYGDKDAFERLGESIGKQFLKGLIDQLVTQQLVMPLLNSLMPLVNSIIEPLVNSIIEPLVKSIIEPLVKSIIKPLTAQISNWMQGELRFAGEVNPVTGEPMFNYNAGYGQYIGAAAAIGMGAYSLSQQKEAGTLTPASGAITGAAAGTMVFPGLGTIIGAGIGAMAGSIFQEEPIIPSIDLLYEVIDGKIQIIAESFENSPKSRELIEQVESTLQGQINFYKNMMEIITGDTFSLEGTKFAATGKNAFQITSATGKNAAEQATDLLMSGIEKIFPDFGEEWMRAWNTGLAYLTSENFKKDFQGKDKQYAPEWRSGQFAPEVLANILSSQSSQPLVDWLDSTITGVRPERTSSWSGTKNQPISWSPGQLTDRLVPFEDLTKKYQELLAPIQQIVGQSLGNAFLDSLSTKEFSTFKDSLKNSLYESIKQGLAQGFVNEVINKVLFSGMASSLAMMNQYASGTLQPIITLGPGGEVTGEISPLQQVMDVINTFFANLDSTLSTLEPVWKLFTDRLGILNISLGLNTTALTGSSGTIDNFINELTGSSLNPAGQSIAGVMEKYNTALEQAKINPANLPAYYSEVKNAYLPMMQGISPNYQESYGSVVGDLVGLKDLYTPIVAPEYHELLVNEPIPSPESPYYEGGASQAWDESVSQEPYRAKAIGSGGKDYDLLALKIAEKLGPMLLDLKETIAAPKEISGNLTFEERGFAHLMAQEIKNDMEIAEALKKRL